MINDIQVMINGHILAYTCVLWENDRTSMTSYIFQAIFSVPEGSNMVVLPRNMGINNQSGG